MKILKIIAILIPCFPLLGFLLNRFFGKLSSRFVSITGCSAIFLSFMLSIFISIFTHFSGEEKFVAQIFPWINAGYFKIEFSFLLDRLSFLMMLVVTGVSFFIHIYSTGYMKGDKNYHLYFSYLNLFVFMMLVLVMADNLLLTFLGWEGVGLCSYLLIGFWFEEWERARAGMKAFVVNRVGDFGFLLGIILLFWTTWELGDPTLNYEKLSFMVERFSPSVITAICLLLFLGATGKSAQLPLYVWLPDAMAGPTPVSALIHAATMVTAGVYMISRLNFLYSLSPFASDVVATVGVLTAVFAGTMGLVSTGIKKVLAYSTISQLGYMFLGVGVQTYLNAMFHLTTHAFFKALLFLGAGSVMHAMKGEEDITKMGNLKKYIPHTSWTFLFGALALSGVPPFAGFFSKDEILLKTYESGHTFLYFLGILGAFITSIYTFRLFFLVFEGRENFDKDKVHPHESPPSMLVPLFILALLSLISGIVLGFPHHSLIEHYFGEFFKGFLTRHHPPELLLMGISTVISLSGIFTSYYIYRLKPEISEKIKGRFRRTYNLLWNKYWVDEIYYALFVKRTVNLSLSLKSFDLGIIDFLVNLAGRTGVFISRISGFFDLRGVDGVVNGIADSTISAGDKVRRVQTGMIQNYLFIFLMGLLGLLVYKIFGGLK